jgi:transcriptional regulator with XRE-family HTH domain
MVGDRIKTARERKVLGQAELAKKAGISANTLYRIEAGVHKPRPATIRKIAQALDIPAETLVQDTEEQQRRTS